jgi:hypothetical protein
MPVNVTGSTINNYPYFAIMLAGIALPLAQPGAKELEGQFSTSLVR